MLRIVDDSGNELFKMNDSGGIELNGKVYTEEELKDMQEKNEEKENQE